MITKKISPIWDRMRPYLEDNDFLITGSGVRYGSVIYLGFGGLITRLNGNRRMSSRFPVELEVGADNWAIIDCNTMLVQSQFSDVDQTRFDLKKLLVGRELHRLTLKHGTATLECSERLTIKMDVQPNPASGFLIAFDVMDEVSWESVDGENISSD